MSSHNLGFDSNPQFNFTPNIYSIQEIQLFPPNAGPP